LVRIRGVLHVELAAETAAATQQLVGVGVGLFDDRALAISTGAGTGIPRPIQDTDSEKWMWIDFVYLGLGPILAVAADFAQESEGTGLKVSHDFIIDSKAKRKWDENLVLVWKLENLPIEGTGTEIDASVFGRMLVMPP